MNSQPLAITALAVMSLCLCGLAPPPDMDASMAAGGHDGTDPNHPVIITSDSRAFCNRLAAVIDAYGPPLRQDVDDLRAQGTHLCHEGKVRSGIVQLRRALMALKEDTHS
ncbi:hypothetical protein [Gluconacetobacter takamatsuzukensis]|uniref:UrcA family protein n=1 Tax=Gluconacetobacter takamatsuzukensis TaxID=1286190 RepID=A0A7W4PMT5_9PROT|nr:hypothetical protein [Gluconacetobacter takamatsuzukensis]MBB2203902.1 hypothetical protein [Gluconacetobacter takamatsuzukensis]